MPSRIFPLTGTPEFEDVKTRYENGESYASIGQRIGMTAKGVKDQLLMNKIQRRKAIVSTKYEAPPDASWEEHLRIIKDMDRLVAIHQKVPTEISIEYKTDLPIALVQSADWQLGQFGVDYQAFEDDMNAIANEEGVYLDIGGDAWQNVIQASKIGSSHDQIPIPVQLGLTVLTFKRLRGKINCVRTGNHSHWSASLTGEDWLGEKARQFKLIYTKHGARVNLKVGNQSYPYMARHVGRYNSSFNLTHSNKQEQRMNYPWARFTVFEHKHIAALEQYRYNNKECLAIRPGTYAVRDDYAEQWGFYGAHVANPTIVLFPKEDRMVGFKDMYDAFEFLRAVRK